jgi:membrane-bound serine protease (ClpP class)
MSRRSAPAAACLAALLAAGAASAAEPAREALVYSVTLEEAVHPITAAYFKEAVDRANAEGAALLILKLDTPGGLVSSTEDMIRAITGSRVPVVVYVFGSKAASAGFFLTIAADVAVMAPGTRMGAAHPVSGLGEIPKESPMAAKLENDIAAYARSLAANRGRNTRAAEEAVRVSRAFTEREALQAGLIDFVAADEAEILRLLDGRSIRRFDGRRETLSLARVRTVTLDMSTRERFLSFLADPNVALFLLLLGAVGLYIEFTHPGMIAPGLIGGMCLLLFALASRILPINWVGVGLILLGVVMFLLEIKVTSYGLLTLGGLACLILGSLMLFRPGEGGIPEVRVAWWAVGSLAGSAGVIMAVLTGLVVRSHRVRPATGTTGLVGEIGTALTDLAPEGRVFVHGEYWNARAARPVARGARVRVVAVRDLCLDVEETV